jgi:molecular chaperone GrpE
MTKDNQPNPTVSEPATPPQPAPAPADELEKFKTQAAENWDKFLRVSADFDNYRKRVARERDELVRATRESLIHALLPALDNLERALDHSPDGTPLHDGLLQVQKQFARSLGEFGVTEIIAKPGDPFDPAVHEAVSQVESADHPDGVIVEQLQSAYKIGDRLLRPARVIVSKGAPSPA